MLLYIQSAANNTKEKKNPKGIRKESSFMKEIDRGERQNG